MVCSPPSYSTAPEYQQLQIFLFTIYIHNKFIFSQNIFYYGLKYFFLFFFPPFSALNPPRKAQPIKEGRFGPQKGKREHLASALPILCFFPLCPLPPIQSAAKPNGIIIFGVLDEGLRIK